MNRYLKVTLVMTLSLSAMPAALAAEDRSAHHAPASTVTTDDAKMTMADGEIKKVDKEAGKITIKHGPLPNLGMPQMTMVFRVKDAACWNR
jgi:Cu(I)/Ag(I) efflux system protein CusF